MYNVNCTMYNIINIVLVLCTLYNVHCTVYIRHIMNTVHCTMYSVQYTMTQIVCGTSIPEYSTGMDVNVKEGRYRGQG